MTNNYFDNTISIVAMNIDKSQLIHTSVLPLRTDVCISYLLHPILRLMLECIASASVMMHSSVFIPLQLYTITITITPSHRRRRLKITYQAVYGKLW